MKYGICMQLYTVFILDILDLALKVPKCEIFDPFFFTPINPIWVGDLRTGENFFYFMKTTADIRHFVFFYAG